MYISGVNTSFTGNRASYGGAIYVSGDNYTIEGSIFKNNNASYDVYAVCKVFWWLFHVWKSWYGHHHAALVVL